jgi:diaminopimelate epimerase
MHSLGNDFVVIDGVTQYLKLQPALVKRLCHRKFGIGADQLLVLEPPIERDADFYLKIFNE